MKTKIKTLRAVISLCLSCLVIGLAQQGFAQGTWTVTGALNTARAFHTATLLPNGKVLVAGGETYSNGGFYFSSAELYDPATGTWTATGALNTTHSSHTATLLPNGKVLLTGSDTGYGSGGSSAELYDPATGTWTATGALNTGRHDLAAILLLNTTGLPNFRRPMAMKIPTKSSILIIT